MILESLQKTYSLTPTPDLKTLISITEEALETEQEDE